MDDRKLTVDDILYAALHDYEDFDLRATCAIYDINPDTALRELADRLNSRTFLSAIIRFLLKTRMILLIILTIY